MVAPDSRCDNKPYVFEKDLSHLLPFADVRDIILGATMAGAGYNPAPAPGLPFSQIVDGVREGARNASLASAVGHMFASGASYRQALEFAMFVNSRNSPSLDEQEVASVVDSIFRIRCTIHHPFRGGDESDETNTAPGSGIRFIHCTSAISKNATNPENHCKIEKPPCEGNETNRSEENDYWAPVALHEMPATPPVDWVFEGYIARRRSTEFVGIWKSGKTTFISQLLKTMAYVGSIL